MKKSNQIFVLSIFLILFSSTHIMAKSAIFPEKDMHFEAMDSYDNSNDYLAIVDVTTNKFYPKSETTVKSGMNVKQQKIMLQYAWMIITGIAILLLCIWVKERAD